MAEAGALEPSQSLEMMLCMTLIIIMHVFSNLVVWMEKRVHVLFYISHLRWSSRYDTDLFFLLGTVVTPQAAPGPRGSWLCCVAG